MHPVSLLTAELGKPEASQALLEGVDSNGLPRDLEAVPKANEQHLKRARVALDAHAVTRSVASQQHAITEERRESIFALGSAIGSLPESARTAEYDRLLEDLKACNPRAMFHEDEPELRATKRRRAEPSSHGPNALIGAIESLPVGKRAERWIQTAAVFAPLKVVAEPRSLDLLMRPLLAAALKLPYESVRDPYQRLLMHATGGTEYGKLSVINDMTRHVDSFSSPGEQKRAACDVIDRLAETRSIDVRRLSKYVTVTFHSVSPRTKDLLESDIEHLLRCSGEELLADASRYAPATPPQPSVELLTRTFRRSLRTDR